MFDESKCDLCGDCLVKCQYVDYDLQKAIKEFTALTEGKDAQILRECVTCMACNEYCTKGANPFDLICQLQERTGVLPASSIWQLLPFVLQVAPGVSKILLKKGPKQLLSLLPVLVKSVTRLKNLKRIWSEPFVFIMEQLAYLPSEVVKGDSDKPVLSLCVMDVIIPKGTIEGQMFDGLTIVKGGEYFCYIGLMHTAKESLVRENAQKFVDNMASLGAKEVVFLHDDCYSMLTKKVRDYGIEVPFKPVHIIEYMLGYLKDHKSNITRLGRKIAYQRPCISRYTPEKEPMLDELFELIGVERPVRRYDRQGALCCGASVMNVNRDKAVKTQGMNLTDAKDHEAEAMIFLCPMCMATLSGACQKRGLSPISLTDVCRMALGEKPFPSWR